MVPGTGRGSWDNQAYLKDKSSIAQSIPGWPPALRSSRITSGGNHHQQIYRLSCLRPVGVPRVLCNLSSTPSASSKTCVGGAQGDRPRRHRFDIPTARHHQCLAVEPFRGAALRDRAAAVQDLVDDQYVPAPLERSTYVLLASLILLLIFWQWRPMTSIHLARRRSAAWLRRR